MKGGGERGECKFPLSLSLSTAEAVTIIKYSKLVLVSSTSNSRKVTNQKNTIFVIQIHEAHSCFHGKIITHGEEKKRNKEEGKTRGEGRGEEEQGPGQSGVN